MLNERKINKQGSVTIPSHLRRELGIRQGEKLKIEVEGTNIRLERIQGSCIICRCTENVRVWESVFICEACIQKIKEAKS